MTTADDQRSALRLSASGSGLGRTWIGAAPSPRPASFPNAASCSPLAARGRAGQRALWSAALRRHQTPVFIQHHHSSPAALSEERHPHQPCRATPIRAHASPMLPVVDLGGVASVDHRGKDAVSTRERTGVQ